MSVLKADGLSKRYGNFVALRNISLRVEPGECFGLIGPNGAGKSTLMRIAAGILSRFEGRCMLFGMDIKTDPEKIKKKIGYLPEEPSLYTRPRAKDLLAYFARLYGVRDGVYPKVREVLQLVGLEERAEDRVVSFSKGMRQRLAIARSIIHEPDLLMLDEPTMGLDPATADRVRRFILSQRKSGRTILLCTHYMDEAEFLCDRIGIIDGGSLVISGGIEEIKGMCGGTGLIEVILDEPDLDERQLSVFDSYDLIPGGIVGRAQLEEAYDVLNPNGIISIKRIRPDLKDSFVMLTEGNGDSV